MAANDGKRALSESVTIFFPNLNAGSYHAIEVRKQRAREMSFVDLPGEIRNRVYHFALIARDGGIRAVRNPARKATRDLRFHIMAVHRAIWQEAKSYFTHNAVAYLPADPMCLIQPESNGKDYGVTTYLEALKTMRTIYFQGYPAEDTVKTLVKNGGRLRDGTSRHVLVHVPPDHQCSEMTRPMEPVLTAMNEGSSLQLTICWPVYPGEYDNWFETPAMVELEMPNALTRFIGSIRMERLDEYKNIWKQLEWVKKKGWDGWRQAMVVCGYTDTGGASELKDNILRVSGKPIELHREWDDEQLEDDGS